MPFFAQNGHEKRGSCSPTVNLKAVESYLKVGGYAPEYVYICGYTTLYDLIFWVMLLIFCALS